MTGQKDKAMPTDYDFGDAFDGANPEDWTLSKPVRDHNAPRVEQIREIAEGQGFTSRQAKPASLKSESEGQINVRAKASIIERFKKIGHDQEPKWPSGYVLQRAVEALERELASKG